MFYEHDVLPGEGPGSGKGEALWKSLHACKGDLICFVDADIRNFHARFVYGLLGPLLQDPEIQYVKAFYERPIRERNALRATGGGRVTELLARPLINLLWPELAGIVQPLSGEYAGRRETLEQVPFFSGYGVELGLLVDIAARFGVDAIAQVDLDRRVHRNQDMQALGRMSFGILQAAFLRLAEEGRSAPGNFATTLVQFSNELVEYRPEPREIVTSRRPPIVTVDDYRRRRADRRRGPLPGSARPGRGRPGPRSPGGPWVSRAPEAIGTTTCSGSDQPSCSATSGRRSWSPRRTRGAG